MMLGPKYTSREAKKAKLISSLRDNGFKSHVPLNFADVCQSEQLMQRYLTVVRQTSAKRRQLSFDEWPTVLQAAYLVLRDLPDGPVVLLHAWVQETGAIIAADRMVAMDVFRSWIIKRSDLGATTWCCQSGIHVEHDFNAHDCEVYFPDGSLEIIVW